MKYNIMGFNQKLLVEKYSSLNGNDVIVLRVLIDILPRMTRIVQIDKKEYKQVTYELLLEDIPFITHSSSTLKKIIQKLINAGLIERYVLNKGGKFTYFRVTEKLEELIYVPTKENKAIKKITKINDDSNVIKPLKGQVTVEDVLGNIEDIRIKAVKDKITVGKPSDSLISIVMTKSIEEVEEVLNDINNEFITSTFIENAFKILRIDDKSKKGIGFNNFEARNYDYDTLERKLLGWETEEDKEKNLSDLVI